MKIVELFSGTKSVSRAMLKLWPDADVTSVDISPEYQPDVCTDIRTWNFYEALEHGEIDVLWASPPCTNYSLANKGQRDLDTADECVQAVWRIIDFLQPRMWVIENPATGLLQKREFMRVYTPYKRMTTYCHFSTKYRKATCLWTNLSVDLPVCNKETPCDHFRRHGYHCETAQKGPSKLSGGLWARGHPTSELWTVPEALVHKLCKASGIPTGEVNEQSARPADGIF